MLLFQNVSFQALLPVVRQHIIDGFTPKALDLFRREFDFFDKVTSISGVLYPLPKEERRAGIQRYTPNLLGSIWMLSRDVRDEDSGDIGDMSPFVESTKNHSKIVPETNLFYVSIFVSLSKQVFVPIVSIFFVS
jgi:hypothetical protein